MALLCYKADTNTCKYIDNNVADVEADVTCDPADATAHICTESGTAAKTGVVK